MPRLPTDYSKTIIYVIKCKDDNITEEYIGSTTDFTKRKSSHKISCNNEKSKSYNQLKYKFIRDNGSWDNWIMLEVEKYPCNDKREAEKREEEIRVERKAKLNSIKAFGAETKEEYYKIYREENKEYIKEQKNHYYKENKEEINTKHKKYYEEHKEQMKERHNQYYKEHKEHRQQYRQEHKEQRNQYDSQKWICPICNKIINLSSKYKHNKSFH
jgi:hypothetical protein